jgi:hypothetical protein
MRLDTMLASVKNVRAALDDFYGSLSDEQKTQRRLVRRRRGAFQRGQGSATPRCPGENKISCQSQLRAVRAIP